MRLSDIEFTRRIQLDQSVANTAARVTVSFASGVARNIVPFMTRCHVWVSDIAAITGRFGVGFENGQTIGAGVGVDSILEDLRIQVVYGGDAALVTSGFPTQLGPIETNWHTILLPEVNFHGGHSTLASWSAGVNIHYRFAELTDDEVVSLAAQRSRT